MAEPKQPITVTYNPVDPRVLTFPDGSTAEGPLVKATHSGGNLVLTVYYKASGGQAQEFTEKWSQQLSKDSELSDMFGRMFTGMGEPDKMEPDS